jgi:hypothetical protein
MTSSCGRNSHGWLLWIDGAAIAARSQADISEPGIPVSLRHADCVISPVSEPDYLARHCRPT